MDAEVKSQVEAFFGTHSKRQFKKGEILIFAGENPAAVFYILQGNVRQYDVAPSGNEVVVNIFKPPAFFPMSYVINRHPNDYFYDAATDVMVRAAPVDAVYEFVHSHPEVAFNLLSRVYNGIDGVLRRQVYLMDGGAGDRLVYELALCCRRLGVRQPDGVCFVPLTEVEIAMRVGLSRETVSRRLQVLKKRGLVRTVPAGLIIPDLTKLEKLLEAGAQSTPSTSL